MRDVKALLVRVDPSKTYLNTLKSQGYVTVVFVANMEADPECEYLNGNVYNIEELIILDNPLFRMSHPNCRCKFNPYGEGTQTAPTPTITPSGPTTTTPSGPTPSSPTAPTTEPPKQDPWYKRWYNKFFPKKKSDFRGNILRRANDAKNSRQS